MVDTDRQGQFDLTTGQEEALTMALARGYCDIPRTVDMEELADELGVSHQALSERLRRAHGTLVGNALERREESRDDLQADTRTPSDATTRFQ
ncbi:helix-turn-helix domain-containing protein [Saliphagus infecundisoli]|uniref:Helix-turn-helix domain-containing protein n=1 Tax=Saliphagus infecundisoli TaxID=1849069 RepID=A0ABD5QEQ4_9EURY|nr:helix-turn-helix domain-containing protein [Saliphagus infecundisoli]